MSNEQETTLIKYSTIVKKARATAIMTHLGQRRKDGQSVFNYLESIVDRLERDEEKITAYLMFSLQHDAVSLRQLKKLGFSAEIVDAIEALNLGETEIAENEIATAVKNAEHSIPINE